MGTKKSHLGEVVASIIQPSSSLLGQLASLAAHVGMPVKALTLGAVNWSQTTPYSLEDVLVSVKRVHDKGCEIPFPWQGVNFLLAVDPGTQIMGWAVIRLPPATPVLDNLLSVPLPGEIVDAGVWHLGKADIQERLGRFTELVDLFPYSRGIKAVSIESQFVGGNSLTSLVIGRARGWVEYWATKELEVEGDQWFPLTPAHVKKQFTGKGNATKERMIEEAEKLFPLQHVKKAQRENAADAIGIATVAYQKYLESHPIGLQS